MNENQFIEMMSVLHKIYPDEWLSYRCVNRAEDDGVLSKVEAMKLRTHTRDSAS